MIFTELKYENTKLKFIVFSFYCFNIASYVARIQCFRTFRKKVKESLLKLK